MDLNEILEQVKRASRTLALLDERKINEILCAVAREAVAQTDYILAENLKDLERMDADDPKYDRLKLTQERLQSIANDISHVADLPSPLGRVLKDTKLPNGLEIKKVSVSFGVIGVIYEARPNVSFDVFSLCLKAGSACVLKGGSDAEYSNQAIVHVIHQVLDAYGVNRHIVQLLPTSRDATMEMLRARGYVDLIIPRGSSRLIHFVREHATIPVIETGAGVCHTYVDRNADLHKATAIIENAKTRRVSVCNALDCLVIHQARLVDLPQICRPLAQKKVIIHADESAYTVLQSHYPAELLEKATSESFGTEFLSHAMAIKTVGSLDEALEHIQENGSGHSECIVTQDEQAADVFARLVDAACVYTNAPTSFTDGAQFGLGAEIGISTQKLHARGPMALEEITTHKWLIKGQGQVRKE